MKIYTLKELKELSFTKELSAVELFSLPSKLSKNMYMKNFPEQFNEFFIKDLSLPLMRRYHVDKVYRFYIDNLEEIKINSDKFLDFIDTLDSNTKNH